MNLLPRKPSLALVVAITALIVAVGWTAFSAFSAIPGADGKITACYQTSQNVLDRIVVLAEPNEECPASYARVTWAQTGPPGPAGATGPAGPAGAAGAAAPALQFRVVKRRVVVRDEGYAIARCPFKFVALGGGGVMGDGTHKIRNSIPWVEKDVAVGWGILPYEEKRFALKGNVWERTAKGGFPEHTHAYYDWPRLLSMEARGFKRDPAEIVVWVVCAGGDDRFIEAPRPISVPTVTTR